MFNLNIHRLIHQKDRGFTLIEMLAVLTIIGILTVIAVPNFFTMMSRAKLSNSVERVRDTLELSRSQTTQKNKPCKIYIPNDGNQIISDCLISADSTSLGITGLDGSSLDGLPSVKLDDKDDILIETKDLPKDLSVPPKRVDSIEITYNFRGITRNSGTVVLSSRSNSGGEKRCLIIEDGIGLISTGMYDGAKCQVGQ